MTRERTLILLGVCITVSPFVGLPYSWLSVLVPVLGVLCMLTAISLIRSRTKTPPVIAHEKETPIT